MISALAWVPKGAAKQNPQRLNLTEQDFNRIASEIGAHVVDAKFELEEAKAAALDPRTNIESTVSVMDTSNEAEEDELAKYNLAAYDEEEGEVGVPVFGKTEGLTYHDSNTQDPYILVEDKIDEEEELDEMEILPTDNLLIACKTEEEISHLAIYLYEREEDNLYVHHDILLPSFPLCVEWLDYTPSDSKKGNFVAIGTFEPEIEIWDIDTIDAIYPSVILGGSATPKEIPTTRKKRALSKKVNDLRHVGAVTAISWNKAHRNLILSASVDSTIKLWDLSGNCETAVKSYNHHTDKVAAVCWNISEPTVFLSGGYDDGGRVCALDSRSPDAVSSWIIGSDVECIKWDPFRSNMFLVSSEDGIVRCFDARSPTDPNGICKPLYSIHAHDAAVSSLELNPHIDGLLVTGGADKITKVWDVREGSTKTCIVTRNLGVGKVFSSSFCMDSPWVLAATGSSGKIMLWNLEGNAGVARTFGADIGALDSKRKEVVGVEEVPEDENDDEEEASASADEKMDQI